MLEQSKDANEKKKVSEELAIKVSHQQSEIKEREGKAYEELSEAEPALEKAR